MTAHILPEWLKIACQIAAAIGLIGLWFLLVRKSFKWREDHTDRKANVQTLFDGDK